MKGTIVYPYTHFLSKNFAHWKGDKKLGYTRATQKAMDDISILIRPPFYGYKWNKNRIKVTITVYRPTGRSDAQNFVDTISDAIQVGIGVNDCEYDVSAIGELDSNNPRIVIEVEQEEKDD